MNVKMKRSDITEGLIQKTVFWFLLVSMLVVLIPLGIATQREVGMLVSHKVVIGSLFAVLLDVIFAMKTRNYENALVVLFLILNLAIIPVIMYASGGLNSAAIIWSVAGVIVCIFSLRDWKMIVTTCISFFGAVGNMIVCFVRPDLIANYKSSYFELFLAEMLSFWSVVTILVVLMYIRVILYNKKDEQYERQQRELENALKTQSAFLANMSHEIRTPINTIIGLNEMTLREDISDEVAENSQHIQSASKMLLSVINDVLDISKIESGKMDIVDGSYELDQMLSDVVNMNWLRAQDKKLDFIVEVSEELPSKLWGDEVRIKQILNNLISNAIKYTKEGFVKLSVSGTVAGSEGLKLVISVEDSGIGIKKEDISKLFDKFVRVDETNTKGIEGTGLGLSITRQLVELMHGTLTVDSVYHKGSTFTVELPQGIMDATPLGHADYGNKGKKLAGTYRKSFEAPEAKLLVVDDNEMNLMVVKKLLRETKVTVDTVNSGARALEYTMAKRYDLILMDHMMPEMDGVECLKLIRQQEGSYNKLTPVVALTANAMSGSEEKYNKLGFNGYLAKPISGSILEATVIKFLPGNFIRYNLSDETGEEGETKDIVYSNMSALKPIAITMDGPGDMPAELQNKYDIKKINFYIKTEQGVFEDGVELFSDGAIEYMRRGGKAMAVCPSVEDYEMFFAKSLQQAKHVIHFCMAQCMDAGYENAVKAAESFSSVTVLDSGQLSSGIALLALEAAIKSEESNDVAEVLEYVKELMPNVVSGFVIDTPDFMYHNERIPSVIYNLLKITGAKAQLFVKNNKMGMCRFYPNEREVMIKKYVKNELGKKKGIDTKRLFVTGSGCMSSEKAVIEEQVRKYVDFEEVYFSEASSSIAINSGPGSFGLIYRKA